MRVLTYPRYRAHPQPYGRLLYAPMAAAGHRVEELSARTGVIRADVVHLHWPEAVVNHPSLVLSLLRGLALLTVLRWQRARGAKVVWTVHNLGGHEARHAGLQRRFLRAVERVVDGFLCLTHASVAAAEAHFPRLKGKPHAVTPIGDYASTLPPCTRAQGRRRWGWAERLKGAVYFGHIRPYKNVPALVRAFRLIQNTNFRLLVTGRPTTELAGELLQAAEGDRRIHLMLRRLSDEELAGAIAAADLCVFPFADVLNSSSVLAALSAGRPVLVPATPTFAELRDRIGQEWVNIYEGELTASILEEAINAAAVAKRPPARLQGLDWASIAQATVLAYRVAGARDTGREANSP